MPYRINRLEQRADGSWLLNFGADNTNLFEEMKEMVRGLPPFTRRWSPEDRAWVIVSTSWLHELAMRAPGLHLEEMLQTAQAQEPEDRTVVDELRREIERLRRENEWLRREKDKKPPLPPWAARLRIVPEPAVQAFVALHLLPSAPSDLIQAAFRLAARHAHPDTGGNHQAMVTLNQQYQMALFWAREQGEEGW